MDFGDDNLIGEKETCVRRFLHGITHTELVLIRSLDDLIAIRRSFSSAGESDSENSTSGLKAKLVCYLTNTSLVDMIGFTDRVTL